MQTQKYQERRGQLEHYFDRTAMDAWAKLTSDAPVSRIRETVRAGRNSMRDTLLAWMPRNLRGIRVLDAGCGTGALAIEAACRGAHVVGVDIAPALIDLARSRQPFDLNGGKLEFIAGDMLDKSLGAFDYVVAMDSLIHYNGADVVQVLGEIASRTGAALMFTFAPRTPALALMHATGKLFPRGNRAPAIEPITERLLRRLIAEEHGLQRWRPGRTQRIDCGFYISQAMELVRA